MRGHHVAARRTGVCLLLLVSILVALRAAGGLAQGSGDVTNVDDPCAVVAAGTPAAELAPCREPAVTVPLDQADPTAIGEATPVDAPAAEVDTAAAAQDAEPNEPGPPQASVDISVSVTPDNQNVPRGDPITFTVAIVFTIGVGEVFDNPYATGSGEYPSGAGLQWTMGPSSNACQDRGFLLSCDIGTYSDLPENPAGVYAATASISSPSADVACGTVVSYSFRAGTLLGDREDTGSVTVACPEVSITKTAVNPVVPVGQDIEYIVTVTNTGVVDGAGIAWSDPLPVVEGQTWLVLEQDQSNPTCALDANGGIACAGIALAANGGSYSVRLASATSQQLQNCGTFASTATLNAGGAGSATASVNVACGEVFELSVTPDGATAEPGDEITFDVTLINVSDEPHDSTVAIDALPTNPGLAWSVTNAPFSNCSITGASLRCATPQMLPDERRTVTISSPTTAQSCGEITVTATWLFVALEVSSDSGSITVTCPQANVAFTRQPVATEIGVGQPIGFSLTATNPNGHPVEGTTFSHLLPAGFAWTIDAGSELCAIDGGALFCTLDRLEPGESFTVGISAPTGPEHCLAEANLVTFQSPGSGNLDTVVIRCPTPAVPSAPSTLR